MDPKPSGVRVIKAPEQFRTRGRGMALVQSSAPCGRGKAAKELSSQPRRSSSIPTRKHATQVYTSEALVVPVRAMDPPTPNSSDKIGDGSQFLVLPPGPITPANPHSSDDHIGEDSQSLVLPPGPTVDIMAQKASETPHSPDDIGEVKAPIFDDTDDIMSMWSATPDSSDDIGEVTTQSSEVEATAPFEGPHEGGEDNLENGWEDEKDAAAVEDLLERRRIFGSWFKEYREEYLNDAATNFSEERVEQREKFARQWTEMYEGMFDAAKSSTKGTWVDGFTEGSPQKKAKGENVWPLTLVSLHRR